MATLEAPDFPHPMDTPNVQVHTEQFPLREKTKKQTNKNKYLSDFYTLGD